MLEIYFHVGLGKTGSKYLQFNFFPYLEGIKYIHMTRYRKSKDIIKKAGQGRFLISREFDRQFYDEIDWFSEDFKDVGAIIVLRRHDEWILSQFKRYVKNGHRFSFDEFFNLYDTGFFKLRDMMFYDKILYLEKKFTKKPLVLLYEELKKNPKSFLDRIAKYTKTTYDEKKVQFKRKHKSYDDKQLRLIHTIARRIDLIPGDSKIKKYLYVYPVRYPILYAAKYLPDFLIPDIKLMPEKEKLDAIKDYFKDDWQMCLSYVKDATEDLLDEC